VAKLDHVEVQRGGAGLGENGGGEGGDALLDGVAGEGEDETVVDAYGGEETGGEGAGDAAVVEDEGVEFGRLGMLELPTAVFEEALKVGERGVVELRV
jgi:hypothetical protein